MDITRAVLTGDLETLKKWVEREEGRIDCSLDESLIYYACEKGHLDIVKYLVWIGMDYSEDVLVIGAKTGNLELMNYFVSLGMSMDIRRCRHDIILNSSKNGHLHILKHFFKVSDNIPATEHCDSLRLAVKGGYLEVVKYLVSLGAYVSNTYYGLSVAASSGYFEMVKYFCEVGVDVRTDHNKAFLKASTNGHLSIVMYLVSMGSEIRQYEDYALRNASMNGHLDVVMYLVSLGLDIHSCEDQAVKRASENGHYEVANYLISIGADISKTTERYQRYILFCEKMKNKAQKKIYFWWIPICYDVNRETGKRMMMKNLEKAKELGMEFKL
jgi:ankyrin repeat protein